MLNAPTALAALTFHVYGKNHRNVLLMLTASSQARSVIGHVIFVSKAVGMTINAQRGQVVSTSVASLPLNACGILIVQQVNCAPMTIRASVDAGIIMTATSGNCAKADNVSLNRDAEVTVTVRQVRSVRIALAWVGAETMLNVQTGLFAVTTPARWRMNVRMHRILNLFPALVGLSIHHRHRTNRIMLAPVQGTVLSESLC